MGMFFSSKVKSVTFLAILSLEARCMHDCPSLLEVRDKMDYRRLEPFLHLESGIHCMVEVRRSPFLQISSKRMLLNQWTTAKLQQDSE